jgi:hypothetical protein
MYRNIEYMPKPAHSCNGQLKFCVTNTQGEQVHMGRIFRSSLDDVHSHFTYTFMLQPTLVYHDTRVPVLGRQRHVETPDIAEAVGPQA